ncbi:zinc-binding dehydrogenase [Stappia sp. F7233]|uniref:Zinc-binding dehydrogenase n=1 Tax=Stappia albiluteola TaxID=2758565 RepID=A0A839ACG4_9HYPH|nr:zinc-binding dehydrogenase [Stappia albiluteola]MBA5776836.1 zinc-binding dehydrogenase [Stappia albiluteola]
MRAIQIERFGGPEVLRLVELPKPQPAPSEILVRVAASGVNFADTLMRSDEYAATPPLPSVLGSEVAGIVEGIGSEVDGLREGMRVAAPLFAAGIYFGGYADYVTIDARYAVPVPDDLSFDKAVALMVQGLTALYLTRQADPKGKTVLVNAAAGGVGSLLVQLAKQAGARTVIAAASTSEKLAFARELGANAAVNYTLPDHIDRLMEASGGQGPDIIYESVGGAALKDGLKALAPRGQLITYGALNIHKFSLGTPELLGLIFRNQSLTGFALVPLLTPDLLQESLKDLFASAAAGELAVTIGASYPLERAMDAHRALESRTTTGKVVLTA